MQVRQFHRFGENLVGALPNGSFCQIRVALTSEHYNRNSRFAIFGLPQQLWRISIGKVKVEYQDIWTEPLQLHFCVPAIGSFRHEMSLRYKVVADAGPHDGIDIDNQDSVLTQSAHLPTRESVEGLTIFKWELRVYHSKGASASAMNLRIS